MTPAERLLEQLPDVPRWIDTRGVLLSGRARVFGAGQGARFEGVVVAEDHRFAAVVGRPPAEFVARTAERAGARDVLVQTHGADAIASALPRWKRERVLLHRLPDSTERSLVEQARGEPDTDPSGTGVRLVAAGGPLELHDVPAELRRELDAVRAHVPLALWIEAGRAVSFCYPLPTESLWDVAVDTLERFRGRGLAGRCFRRMAVEMLPRGRRAVWGAVESNAGSRRAADKLGFRPIDELVIFTRTGEELHG